MISMNEINKNQLGTRVKEEKYSIQLSCHQKRKIELVSSMQISKHHEGASYLIKNRLSKRILSLNPDSIHKSSKLQVQEQKIKRNFHLDPLNPHPIPQSDSSSLSKNDFHPLSQCHGFPEHFQSSIPSKSTVLNQPWLSYSNKESITLRQSYQQMSLQELFRMFSVTLTSPLSREIFSDKEEVILAFLTLYKEKQWVGFFSETNNFGNSSCESGLNSTKKAKNYLEYLRKGYQYLSRDRKLMPLRNRVAKLGLELAGLEFESGNLEESLRLTDQVLELAHKQKDLAIQAKSCYIQVRIYRARGEWNLELGFIEKTIFFLKSLSTTVNILSPGDSSENIRSLYFSIYHTLFQRKQELLQRKQEFVQEKQGFVQRKEGVVEGKQEGVSGVESKENFPGDLVVGGIEQKRWSCPIFRGLSMTAEVFRVTRTKSRSVADQLGLKKTSMGLEARRSCLRKPGTFSEIEGRLSGEIKIHPNQVFQEKKLRVAQESAPKHEVMKRDQSGERSKIGKPLRCPVNRLKLDVGVQQKRQIGERTKSSQKLKLSDQSSKLDANSEEKRGNRNRVSLEIAEGQKLGGEADKNNFYQGLLLERPGQRKNMEERINLMEVISNSSQVESNTFSHTEYLRVISNPSSCLMKTQTDSGWSGILGANGEICSGVNPSVAWGMNQNGGTGRLGALGRLVGSSGQNSKMLGLIKGVVNSVQTAFFDKYLRIHFQSPHSDHPNSDPYPNDLFTEVDSSLRYDSETIEEIDSSHEEDSQLSPQPSEPKILPPKNQSLKEAHFEQIYLIEHFFLDGGTRVDSANFKASILDLNSKFIFVLLSTLRIFSGAIASSSQGEYLTVRIRSEFDCMPNMSIRDCLYTFLHQRAPSNFEEPLLFSQEGYRELSERERIESYLLSFTTPPDLPSETEIDKDLLVRILKKKLLRKKTLIGWKFQLDHHSFLKESSLQSTSFPPFSLFSKIVDTVLTSTTNPTPSRLQSSPRLALPNSGSKMAVGDQLRISSEEKQQDSPSCRVHLELPDCEMHLESRGESECSGKLEEERKGVKIYQIRKMPWGVQEFELEGREFRLRKRIREMLVRRENVMSILQEPIQYLIKTFTTNFNRSKGLSSLKDLPDFTHILDPICDRYMGNPTISDSIFYEKLKLFLAWPTAIRNFFYKDLFRIEQTKYVLMLENKPYLMTLITHRPTTLPCSTLQSQQQQTTHPLQQQTPQSGSQKTGSSGEQEPTVQPRQQKVAEIYYILEFREPNTRVRSAKMIATERDLVLVLNEGLSGSSYTIPGEQIRRIQSKLLYRKEYLYSKFMFLSQSPSFLMSNKFLSAQNRKPDGRFLTETINSKIVLSQKIIFISTTLSSPFSSQPSKFDQIVLRKTVLRHISLGKPIKLYVLVTAIGIQNTHFRTLYFYIPALTRTFSLHLQHSILNHFSPEWIKRVFGTQTILEDLGHQLFDSTCSPSTSLIWQKLLQNIRVSVSHQYSQSVIIASLAGFRGILKDCILFEYAALKRAPSTVFHPRKQEREPQRTIFLIEVSIATAQNLTNIPTIYQSQANNHHLYVSIQDTSTFSVVNEHFTLCQFLDFKFSAGNGCSMMSSKPLQPFFDHARLLVRLREAIFGVIEELKVCEFNVRVIRQSLKKHLDPYKSSECQQTTVIYEGITDLYTRRISCLSYYPQQQSLRLKFLDSVNFQSKELELGLKTPAFLGSIDLPMIKALRRRIFKQHRNSMLLAGMRERF